MPHNNSKPHIPPLLNNPIRGVISRSILMVQWVSLISCQWVVGVVEGSLIPYVMLTCVFRLKLRDTGDTFRSSGHQTYG